ncbi:MAG: post-COAP-1 domain-containing protein [Planctomycetota bacterium]
MHISAQAPLGSCCDGVTCTDDVPASACSDTFSSQRCACLGCGVVAGGPANDLCSAAIDVSGATFPVTFDTTGATLDGPGNVTTELGSAEVCADIWYSYTSTCTGNLTASLCQDPPYFDSVVTIYDGGCPSDAGTELASGDEQCLGAPLAGPGEVTIPAIAGTPYMIRVSGWNGSIGAGVLNLSCDSDGDGVADGVDNCLSIANAAQEDSDSDGVGDACDNCWLDPNNDVDGDGLCGEVDVAPSTASSAFSDGYTSGVVVGADPGVTFVFRDGLDPAEGVLLVAQGTGVVHLGLDGSAGSYEFLAPGRYVITRHSVGINVIEGAATAVFEFDGATQTIAVAAGGEATIVELPRGVEVTVGGAPGAVTLNDAPLQPETPVDTTPPLITAFNGLPLLVSVGGQVNFDVWFEDNVGDTNVATFDFGDGSTNAIVNPASSPTTQSHVYAAAGIYPVTATVTDSRGSQDTAQLIVVVFDPAAGFTTGGGWIVPDSESFINNIGVTNTVAKANFGFIVKYKQGVSNPDGNLEFQYKAGDINLKSSGMAWMVVISNSKVRFKGLATINNRPDVYTFKVTAEDNGEPGVGHDTFKIEVWTGVVDTENGPPTPKHTAKGVLGGGNIKIQY